MRTHIFEGRRNRWAVVALVAPGLWLAPAISQAENRRGGGEPTLFATLKLYEVQEGTDFRVRGQAPVLRLANATLVGTATGEICDATAMPGVPAQDPCAFDTTALSRVPLAPGDEQGDLDGDFQLLFDAFPQQQLLSDLVLVAKGEVEGTIDLRPLLDPTNPQPIAFMEGRWMSKKLGVKGTFTGTFFVPFPDPTGTCATGYAYIDRPGGTGLVCLEPNETSLGNPVTKVIATFLKTGKMDAHDKDKHDNSESTDRE
jgi:hypothetical protein